jgi:hypothetical protein
MLRTHFGVCFHTGLYGGGSKGIVSTEAMQENLSRFASSPHFWSTLIFLVMAGTACALLSITLLLRRHDRQWLQEHAPTGIMLGTSLVLGLLACLKHWQPWYLIASAVCVPPVVLWLIQTWGKRFRVLWVGGSFAAAGIVFVVVLWTRATEFQSRREESREVQAVLALPLRETGMRLWAYRAHTREYLAHFACSTSGLDLSAIIEDSFPRDLEYCIFNGLVQEHGWQKLEDVDWDYAVFPHNYFPTFEHVPEMVRTRGTLLLEGKHLIVVRNAKLGLPARSASDGTRRRRSGLVGIFP